MVADQVGTPTSAADLAAALLSILERYDPACHYQETYHYSNEGVCSWYDFASAIMEIAHLPCKVLPLESAHYPQIAQRPHYSVLNKSAIKQAWGLEIPNWRVSLAGVIRNIEHMDKELL